MHKKFKLLEIIDRSGNIKKAKSSKFYKILFPDKHEEIIFNLSKFCQKNILNPNCMNRTLKLGCFHKGFKLL